MLFPLCAEAQQGGGTTGGTAPKNAPPPPAAASPSSRIPPQRLPEQILISGSVVLEDGTPPPFEAAIELDCGISVTKVADTDISGRFSFRFGDTRSFSQVLPDASQKMPNTFDRGSGGDPFDTAFPTSVQAPSLSSRLAGCELRAKFGGYRSSAIRLGGSPLSGLNEVGTIVIYPMERVRGSAVTATSLLAPKAARKSVEKAEKAFREKKLEETEALLKSAIAIYPKYGEAYFLLGQLYRNQQRYQEARDAFTKAKDIDSLYVSPYIQLGWLASIERNWQETANLTEQALALDPVSFPEGYYLNALANYNLRNLDLAEKRARQEKLLDPVHEFPRVHLILANILASKNDTAGSIAEMKNYLQFAPNSPDAGVIRERLQEEEKLANAGGK